MIPQRTSTEEMRAALYAIRDAHRMGPDAFCDAINHDLRNVEYSRVQPWMLVRAERSEGFASQWSLVVQLVLRAAELGRLPNAKSADLQALERWLSRYELGLET